MFELKGKRNMAKVFTDLADAETISQVTNLCNQEYAAGNQIRIMPDCHAGSGCVIGTTMTLTSDKINPALVGVDIGCFAGETKVWTGASYQPIKDLAEHPEQILLTTGYQKEAGYPIAEAFISAKAFARKTREQAPLVRVTYCIHHHIKPDEHISVRCTPDHQFLTVRSGPPNSQSMCEKETVYVVASKLTPGTQLVSQDWYVTVASVEPLPEQEPVYCLNVPETNNFMIEGSVIVHNCGMYAVQIDQTDPDLKKLDQIIRTFVPSGHHVHDTPKPFHTVLDVEQLRCFQHHNNGIREMLAYCSVGTLGGGELVASGKVNSLS